jgi:hypothetical protein
MQAHRSHSTDSTDTVHNPSVRKVRPAIESAMRRKSTNCPACSLGRALLALLLLLLLSLPLVCDGVSAPAKTAKRQAFGGRVNTYGKIGSKIKSINCKKNKCTGKLMLCASRIFQVVVAGQPGALVLRRGDDAASWPRHRQLQDNDDELVLTTTALVVIKNDLVVQGKLTIGNVTISDDDIAELQGPPGK